MLEPLVPVLFLAFAAVATIAGIAGRRAEIRRRDALAALAADLEWRFIPDRDPHDDFEPASDAERIVPRVDMGGWGVHGATVRGSRTGRLRSIVS